MSGFAFLTLQPVSSLISGRLCELGEHLVAGEPRGAAAAPGTRRVQGSM